MEVSKKQRELDVIKWNKSVEMGADACGSFDYCAYCDKTKANPCEKAFNKLVKAVNKEIATTAEKSPAKKATATKKAPAKKTASKSTAKK